MPLTVGSENASKAVNLEVVDAQVHANQLGAQWRSLDPSITLNSLLTTMDALGISGVIIDEFTELDAQGRMLPGEVEPDGIWRPQRPFSKMAVSMHPDRFRYLGRIDRHDPRMPELMKSLREDEHGPSALRLQAGPKRVVWSDPDFAKGAYAPFFEQAEKHSIPIFLVIAPRADLLAPYAKQFPGCQFILDHMGVVSGVERPGPDESVEQRLRRFDQVVDLAQFPNVAVKWCHIERFASMPYPFPDVMRGLRRVVDAFGANRVMWAGDPTESGNPSKTDFPITWSQALHHVLDTDLLTLEEKTWVLGRTARSILQWNGAQKSGVEQHEPERVPA